MTTGYVFFGEFNPEVTAAVKDQTKKQFQSEAVKGLPRPPQALV